MLRAYLRQYRGVGVYLLLCGGICLALFSLFGYALAPVLYALGLCAALGLLHLVGSFVQFRRKRLQLQAMDPGLTLEHLPRPSTPLEADYQALLSRLYAAKAQEAQQAEDSRRETLEYYTLWVHQIKTPISAMDLILQAGEGRDNQELRGELFQISRYVEMVLCYLRLGPDASDFVFAPCNLDELLRGALRTYAGQFIRRQVSLNYTPTEFTVVTDEKWLLFVIEQLLSNCLKYTPGGTITIRMEGPCTLMIADTGIGIAPEDLPRIFEKGYTGLNGRSQRHTTGLGLYLCRKILDRLGHEISITSTPGVGTTVRLHLEENSPEFDKMT